MAGGVRSTVVRSTWWLLATLAILLPGPVAAAGKAVELVDMSGRKVLVPEQVRSVVPLGGALRFLVYMRSLDLVAGIEAIENKRQSAGRLYGLATAEKAKTLPVIGEGGPGKLPDFEKIVEIWPDLILAMGVDSSQVETIQAKTGIPVFVLSYGGAGALDIGQVKEAIEQLGTLLGRRERAGEVVAFIDHSLRDLAAKTAGIAGSDRPTTYVGALSFKGAHGITSTEAFHASLAWAGGKNVADEIGLPGHLFIDPEKLLFWNPDTLFLDAGNFDAVQEDFRKNPEFYRKLKAVRGDRVFLSMPYNYYHTNIEIALADAYYMAKVLYPECFADIDPAGKADEIFSFFTGVAAYGALQKEFHGFGRVGFEEKGLVVR